MGMAAVLAVMLIVVLIGWGETNAPVTLQRVLRLVPMIPSKLNASSSCSMLTSASR